MSDQARYNLSVTFADAMAIILYRDSLSGNLVDQAVKLVATHIAETERAIARLKAEIEAVNRLPGAAMHKASIEGDKTD